ncbi:2095_t:CDS:2 [Gigaspora margarita]|uniref:2095_t:CDS:1 n=1 Tax=Gigaspora margarita TaxID=4874 RepID=A0ABN7WB65_GIGMA|nr:2095_t:CDS:2 [Gigaspora margarita]
MYSVALKDNPIFYIGGTGVDVSMSETTLGDPIGLRYGHSAVLNGLILIYGGSEYTGIQAQPNIATLNISAEPYIWKAITTNTTKNAPLQSLMFHSAILYGIYMIVAFGRFVPSQPPPASTQMTLNNNLYIFNTKNYTWVNTFDASNIYGFNSTNSDSISLGAKIGIGIGVVAAVGIMSVLGFLLYKKSRNCKNFPIATPGTEQY